MQIFLKAVREDRTPGGKHKNSSLLKIKIPSPVVVDKPEASTWSSPLIQEFLSIDHSAEVPVFKQGTETKETMDQVMLLAEWQVNDIREWFEGLTFLHEISIDDQTVLVRNSLMELLALGLARRSINLREKVILGQGMYLDIAAANEAGIGEITQRILQLALKVKELRLDNAEYVCLTIIVLLNPGKCCTYGGVCGDGHGGWGREVVVVWWCGEVEKMATGFSWIL